MTRITCRFFNTPAGCRNGATCSFSHVQPSSAGRDEQSSASTVAATPAASSANSPVPKGVCAFYWRNGDCNRGFQCRYRHDQESTSPASSVNPRSGASSYQSLEPFLTGAALSRLNEPGTDALFSLNVQARSPSEVHNLLKRFLYDDYRFRHALDVYGFTSLLSNASSNNTTWVSASYTSTQLRSNRGYRHRVRRMDRYVHSSCQQPS